MAEAPPWFLRQQMLGKTGMGESRAGDGPKALKNQITNSWRKTPPDSTLANLPFCSFLCFVSAKIAFLRCCS